MKKEVLLNGVIVGEIESTGVQDRDIELMREMLKAKGLYKPSSVAKAMFGHARAFAATAERLYNEQIVPRASRSSAAFGPFVVNASFAAELYLKTISRVYGAELRGHDLLGLYHQLPPDAAAHINAVAPRCRAKRGIPENTTFEESVERHRDAFVEWRYVYEKERSSLVQFPVLIYAIEVLHETCRELRARKALRLSRRSRYPPCPAWF